MPWAAFDCKEIVERGGGEEMPCPSASFSYVPGVGHGESPPRVVESCQFSIKRGSVPWAPGICRISLAGDKGDAGEA